MSSDIINALENLMARGRELDQARDRVCEYATPSYWIEDETRAYAQAKDTFLEALDKHVDERIAQHLADLGELGKPPQ